MTGTFNDLYKHELEMLLSAETQMLLLLSRLVKATDTPELRRALEEQGKSCKAQEGILQKLVDPLAGGQEERECLGMKALLEECSSLLKEFASGNLRDAVLIAHMQRAEHYKMAAYSAVADFAKLLGDKEAALQLEHTAKAVTAVSKSLGQIAIQVNAEAYVDTREEKYP